ncbi:HD2 homeodomain mating-type protein Le.a2-4 [Lentinula edodes]|nr:HD2 homeodomain mating-type protein Le.a2-4 [Lentinula edodes]
MDLQSKLVEVRQLVAKSGALWKELHEQRFGTSNKSFDTLLPVEHVSPLQLVIPISFDIQVQKFQLSPQAHQALSSTLKLVEADYIQQFDESYHKLAQTTVPQLRALMPTLVAKLKSGLQSHFETRGLPKIIHDLETYAKEHPPHPSTPPPPTRQSSIPAYEAPVPFNNEYTPILETYFQYDPYPTSRDRQIIAERSGMTRRQIEVWFQNHRRTARQSGITLPAKRPPGAIAPPGLDVPFAVIQGQGGQGQGEQGHGDQGQVGQGEGDGEGQRQNESSGEKRRKARMLDMFNINSKIPRIPGGSSGSGQGMTPDDPIQIDGVPSSMMTTTSMMMISENCDDESRMGMTLTSAGNGISILEPIDVVERMVREKERKAVEEEMREERKKYLSVIAPASFNCNNHYNHDNHPISTTTTTTNPLDSPPSSRDTLFPAPFTRPPAHLQFRYRVAPDSSSSPSSSSTRAFSPSNDTDPPITGTVRPILPPPTWSRLAPPTSYQVPPPPTSTTPHPPPKPKKKPKRPTKEELRLLEDSKRTLEIDEAIMMKRLWFCSFDDRVESGTIRAQGGVSTYESIAGGVVEREKNTVSANSNSNPNKPKSPTSTSKAKSILQKLGVGLDAATCAYTYVLPKAPFWALVRDGGRGERGEGCFSTSSSSLSSSSSASSSFDSSASSDLSASLSSSRDLSSSFDSSMTSFPSTSHSSSSSPSSSLASHEFSVSSSHKPTRRGLKKPAALGPKRRPRNAPSGSRDATSGSRDAPSGSRDAPSGSRDATGGFTEYVNVNPNPNANAKGKGKGKAKAISFDRDESTSFSPSTSTSFPSSSSHSSLSSLSSSTSSSASSASSHSSSASSSSSSLIPPPVPSTIIPQGFPDGFTPFSNNAMAGYYDFGFGGRAQQVQQVQGQGQVQQQQQRQQQQQQQGQQQPSAPAAQSEPESLLSESQSHRDQIGFTYAFGNPYPTTGTTTSIPSSSSSSSSNTIPTTSSSSTSSTSASTSTSSSNSNSIPPTTTTTTTSTTDINTLATAHNEIDVQGIDMNMLNALFSGELGGAGVGGGGSVGGGVGSVGGGIGSGVGSVGSGVGSVGSIVNGIGNGVGSAGTNPYLNPMTMNMGSLASGSIGSSGMAAIAAFGGMAAMNAGMNMGMGVGMGMGGIGGGMGGMGGWSSS